MTTIIIIAVIVVIMGVALVSYGGISASTIKSRSSIPAQADMTIDGSNVDARNIKLSDASALVGTSPAQLSEACQSANINPWSRWSPKYWLMSGGVFTLTQRANKDLGTFAGYDHNAQAPYISSHTADFNFYEGQTGTLWVRADLFLGQINWMDTPFLKSVNMEVTIGGSVVGNAHIALNSSDYLVTSHTLEASFDASAWNSSKTATLRFYFGKDSANSWQELGAIPNIGTEQVVMTFVPKARLRSFTVSDSLRSTLGGYAEIIRTSADVANCYVTQLNGGLGSVTLACHGIDTDQDGVGDLDFTQSDRALWYKRNNEDWRVMTDQYPFVMLGDASCGGTFYSVFDLNNPDIQLTYNDQVDIEIR